MCPPLANPVNGTANAEVNTIKDIPIYTTRYKCNMGFDLVGNSIRKCNPKTAWLNSDDYTVIPKNEWTGEKPQCVGRYYIKGTVSF